MLKPLSTFSWRWKHIHTTQNTNLTFTQNIYEKNLKKNFHRSFSMWKVIIKWMFIPTLISLQFYTQMGKSFFRTDILRKTGTLMRLTKNLVTIPSSLWTRYLIKVIYMWRFALTWHCINITLHCHIPRRSVQYTKLLKPIATNT